jgi:hypothetical protein
MDKFILLSFRNAKYFPKNTKTKDYVVSLDVNKNGIVVKNDKRRNITPKVFKEPLTVYQISNVLHTLVGDRPVPSFRYSFYDHNKELFELALNSYLKIDSPKIKSKIKGEIVYKYISEHITTGKSKYNAYSVPKTIQWFKIKQYFGNSFNEFVNILNKHLGYDTTKEPFEKLRLCYKTYGNKLDLVIEYLVKNNKTPIVNFFKKDSFGRNEISSTPNINETLINGIDRCSFLYGKILVPYDDKFVNSIIKNTTNILDGGFVKIEKIINSDEITDASEFTKVSEISIEKY